jgi:hypothetical protein
LGVGPEIDLIAGEEDGRVRKDEELEIEKGRCSQQ